MSTLSISSVVGSAWTHFKQHGSSVLVILFVYCLISFCLGAISTALAEGTTAIIILFSLFQSVVNTILALGFYRVLLDIVDGGTPELSRLFSQTNTTLILHSIVGSIALGLAVVIGLIFLILPGLYMIFRLQFFSLILLEQDEPKFLEALKESWRLTEGHVLDLVGLFIISILIVLAGVLALFLGLLVAIPVVSIMTAVVYRRLQSMS
jgi:uncharacterized membrane protein